MQYDRDTRNLAGITSKAKDCYTEISGGLKCKIDKDCKFSGSCLKQTSRCATPAGDPVQNLQRCFRARLPKLVLSALKASWDIPQAGSPGRFDAAFRRNTEQDTCVGPTGWKFQTQWDDSKEEWVEPSDARSVACSSADSCWGRKPVLGTLDVN